jgi:hypothetical protein
LGTQALDRPLAISEILRIEPIAQFAGQKTVSGSFFQEWFVDYHDKAVIINVLRKEWPLFPVPSNTLGWPYPLGQTVPCLGYSAPRTGSIRRVIATPSVDCDILHDQFLDRRSSL